VGTYFNYTGVGGSYFGIGLPTSTIITNAEKVICLTPVPDNREPVQGGVLITAQVSFGVSTCTFATILCRQSTLGTSTAVTGNLLLNGGNVGTGTYVASIGTGAGTVSATGLQNTGPFTFQWVDYSGTFAAGLPVYQLTGSTAAGTATITSAVISVTPLAA
jgi:hypothetical protein